MKRFLLIAACSVCALSGGPFAVAQNIAAQAPASDATPQAVLTKLAPPVYPPLARQANIFGDVKVEVAIQQDGTVAWANVVSGHPMLEQAALENARQSHFECRGCGDRLTTLSLTYSFEMKDDDDCCSALSRTPEVRQSLNRISIVAAHMCLCDPAVGIARSKVRSAKCLYLWKCGSRKVTLQ
jgi:TonB family protein